MDKLVNLVLGYILYFRCSESGSVNDEPMVRQTLSEFVFFSLLTLKFMSRWRLLEFDDPNSIWFDLKSSWYNICGEVIIMRFFRRFVVVVEGSG